MSRYLLGTDNGCTVAKAGLFTLDGSEVGAASRKIELITRQSGYAEKDMLKSRRATVEPIREVVEKSRVDPKDIACVGCTGHGNGLYLVDADGEPVRNAIGSMDSRARDYVEQRAAEGVDKAIRAKTMQSIWAGQPNALLAWLRDDEPDSNQRQLYTAKYDSYKKVIAALNPIWKALE